MKKYKLGDLIDVSRGKSLAGEFYATSGNLVRLTMGNFDYINNCFKQNTSKDNLFFSGEVEEKFILNAGDIITPLTEQTPGLLGSTARIPESGKYIQSQDVALVRCKKDKLDDGFAYYLISSESVKKQLGAAAQQTKIRHTSPDKIKDCTVYIPEISIQRKIGNILFTLDKRIENLRAQNRVLEQTAKTIYDYTFLQCAGHQTTYNKTLNSNIPADWEVKKLGDLVEINDSSIKKNEFEYILYLETSGIVENKIEEISSLKSSDAPSRAKRKVKDRTIVYSTVRPEQRHFGILLNPPSNLIVSTGFVTIDSKKDVGDVSFFLYSFLSQDSTIQYLDTIAANSVSSYPSINPSDIENMFVACPDSKTLEKFNMNVTPLFQKQLVNTKQIEALTTQRNTLLPLLMTGQVEV